MTAEPVNRNHRLRVLSAIAGIYLFFALFYYTTLWFNRGGAAAENDPYLNFQGFLNWGGIDYLLKFLLSLPAWWLIFRKLAHWPFRRKLLVHLVTLPLFVIAWQRLYYLVIESLHMFHLTGVAQVWDIYIPALFYMLQFGVMHAYVHFEENKANIRREAALREAVLKSELSALKAQLNPHFLYNVFNTISASVPPGMEQTRQMIAELSDLFRYQLRAAQSEFVPLRDELAFTRKYLDLEKARFEDRLAIHIDVDERLLDQPVPPLILQPIVENAIKHGISPQIEGGTVSIRVWEEQGKIRVSIADTGGGSGKTAVIGKGVGLTNTELRLNKMFDTSLQLSDNQPSGLRVSFSLG